MRTYNLFTSRLILVFLQKRTQLHLVNYVHSERVQYTTFKTPFVKEPSLVKQWHNATVTSHY